MSERAQSQQWDRVRTTPSEPLDELRRRERYYRWVCRGFAATRVATAVAPVLFAGASVVLCAGGSAWMACMIAPNLIALVPSAWLMWRADGAELRAELADARAKREQFERLIARAERADLSLSVQEGGELSAVDAREDAPEEV